MRKFTRQQILAIGGAIAFAGALGVIVYYILKIEKYPLDDAAKIMASYMSKNETHGLATRNQFGGAFPIDLFQPGIASQCKVADSCGIALWFCMDPTSKEFFLAVEHQPWQYDYANLPVFPRSNTFSKSIGRFRYPPAAQINQNALRAFVLNHRGRPNDNVQILDSATVNLAIKEFRSNFGHLSKYNFSFVAENSRGDLADCISRAGAQGYFRYYFGLEETDRTGRSVQNKMRLILVSMDNNGDNQVSGTKKDEPILQSSWPPPPYN